MRAPTSPRCVRSCSVPSVTTARLYFDPEVPHAASSKHTEWCLRHASTLGVTVTADVDAIDPLIAPVVLHVVIDDARDSPLAPFERIELPHALSGAQGTNRMAGLCYLQAQHDLDAIRSYLHRYRDRPQALRAYTRELERLLLWAVSKRGKPLSSLDVDDCESYKAFLASPAERFTGRRHRRPGCHLRSRSGCWVTRRYRRRPSISSKDF